MGLVPVRVIPGLPSPAFGFRGGITVELPNGIRLRTRDVSMAVAAIQLGLAHQQVSEVVKIAETLNRVGDPRRINH